MKSLKLTVAALVASAAFAGVAVARDQIQIAGSSTVLPYAKIVAESFGETYPDFKTPIVESGGNLTKALETAGNLANAIWPIFRRFSPRRPSE